MSNLEKYYKESFEGCKENVEYYRVRVDGLEMKIRRLEAELLLTENNYSILKKEFINIKTLQDDKERNNRI